MIANLASEKLRMARAHRLDLRYDHMVRAVATSPTPMPSQVTEARGLAARLACLKALMDSERTGMMLWLGAPTPRSALS